MIRRIKYALGYACGYTIGSFVKLWYMTTGQPILLKIPDDEDD